MRGTTTKLGKGGIDHYLDGLTKQEKRQYRKEKSSTAKTKEQWLSDELIQELPERDFSLGEPACRNVVQVTESIFDTPVLSLLGPDDPLPSPDEPDVTWKVLSSAAVSKIFYPGNRSPEPAFRLCRACPVRVPCLQWAIDNDDQHGIQGGVTSAERKELKEKYPDAAKMIAEAERRRK